MPIKIKRRKGSFTIYTDNEAGGAGIEFAPLREITAPTAETGLWALTDDGFAAECLGRTEYTDETGRTKRLLTLSFACVWLPRIKDFLFMPFFRSGHYGGTAPSSWAEREVRLERTKRTVRLYAAMLATRGEIDWDRLARVYRSDQPVRTVRKLFREPRVQEMVQRELQTAFAGQSPISAEEIVVLYKRLFEAAQKDKDYRICKDVLETFLHFLGA